MNARLILAAVFVVVPACSSSGPGPVPKFDYGAGKEGGCANIFVYKGSADGREVLVVWTDPAKLKLPDKGSQTFDLAKAPAGLNVAVDLWAKAPKFSPYCNDIAGDEKKLATWKATAGKVTIVTHGPIDRPGGGPKQYKVTVTLEGVVFDDGTGRKATLAKETMADVLVGWYAG